MKNPSSENAVLVEEKWWKFIDYWPSFKVNTGTYWNWTTTTSWVPGTFIYKGVKTFWIFSAKVLNSLLSLLDNSCVYKISVKFTSTLYTTEKKKKKYNL